MDNKQVNNVGIIMDGNGRWAQKRGLVRTAGHYQGTRNIRNIALEANRLGIKTLTLYAFSTENWKRDKSEVEFIMKLPAQFLDEYLGELIDNNVVIVNWILKQNDENYDGIYEIRFDDELNCVYFKSWEMTK